MDSQLTNLLPLERRAVLIRDYKLRVATIAMVLAAILVVIAGALKIPTYVLLTDAVRAKEIRLASISSTLSSSDGAALTARLAALSRDASILTNLANTPSASARVRGVLAIPHTGISISGFTYTPRVGGTPAAMALSGIATERTALRNYQLALQGAPEVRAAALPVSAFAQDTDIAFTISITFTP